MPYDPRLKDKKSQVRFLIQDTDDANPQISDDELGALLDQYVTVQRAAAAANRALAARQAKANKLTIGSVTVDPTGRQTALLNMAASLDASGEAAISVRRAASGTLNFNEERDPNTPRVLPGYEE